MFCLLLKSAIEVEIVSVRILHATHDTCSSPCFGREEPLPNLKICLSKKVRFSHLPALIFCIVNTLQGTNISLLKALLKLLGTPNHSSNPPRSPSRNPAFGTPLPSVRNVVRIEDVEVICRDFREATLQSTHHMGVSLNGGTPETPQKDHFW